MNQKLRNFYHHSLGNFFEAIVNLCIFLPYFFSAKTLLKTLFSPWKNLQSRKTERGFSMGEWFNRFSFDLISRGMGFVMRTIMLLAYLIFQAGFVLFFPVILVSYLIYLPIAFIFVMMEPTEEQVKARKKKEFIESHMLDGSNQQRVEAWFEIVYQQELHRRQWWKLSQLMTLPPLTRDWAAGYTPYLDEVSRELTSDKYQDTIQHIVDRQQELEQISRILVRSEAPNVILVGEDNVGKHTIVDALSKKIYEGTTNSLLAYKRVLEIDMEAILSHFTDQHQRETYFSE
ncbi:hypothetical protein HGB07_07430, partial [Candidatus Roizmanbacteria bacterium]|nr:hypothetical protein [Candidatus Roizmanbacteria bacterium]